MHQTDARWVKCVAQGHTDSVHFWELRYETLVIKRPAPPPELRIRLSEFFVRRDKYIRFNSVVPASLLGNFQSPGQKGLGNPGLDERPCSFPFRVKLFLDFAHMLYEVYITSRVTKHSSSLLTDDLCLALGQCYQLCLTIIRDMVFKIIM